MPRIESSYLAPGVSVVAVTLGLILVAVGLGGASEPSNEHAAGDEARARSGGEGGRASEARPVLASEAEVDDEGSPDGVLRLEGQVVEGDDQPVGGARVTLGDGRSVLTEADGSFAFDGLAEGRYDVIAEHGDGFAESQHELDEHSEPVTLSLAIGPTLVVHVVDEYARPLVGATVEADGRSIVTSAAGSARFRAVDLDSEDVEVRAAGRHMVSERVETGDDAAGTIDRTIVLWVASEISGVVVDAAGRRVPNATVELAHASGDTRMLSDEEGAWRLTHVGTGVYVLCASSEIHIPGDRLAITHDGNRATTGIVIRVETGSELSGFVFDAAGQPAERVRVEVRLDVEPSDARGALAADRAAACGGVRRFMSTGTDARGAFVMQGLAPASYRVSARSRRQRAASQLVHLAHGQRAELRLDLTE